MPRPSSPVLVVVFLRGGADGLALVPPLGDPHLRALRPSIAADRALPLDARFGLHESLAPLLPAYRAGELAIVHAVGSDDDTRSHFEAQERMERAGARARTEPSGWLARHLRTRRGDPPSTLSAVALGTTAPDSLAGAPVVAVLESIESLVARPLDGGALPRALASLYAGGDDALRRAGRDALAMLERLRRLPRAAPSRALAYPAGAFGRGLREIARLVRAEAGMEVACLDLDGWDTHFAQNAALEEPIRSLAAGLAAFRADLGDTMERVTVVVMTELGRRAYENAALGTDHGRASVMLLLGGGVRGGRVLGDWPGLHPAALEPPGDLRVTTDYRDVLAELVRARLGNHRSGEVFPGWRETPRGVFEAR